jgi:hypothetical protein
MTRSVKLGRCLLAFPFVVAALVSCSRQQTEAYWTVQTHTLLSNVFAIHLPKNWRTIRAAGTSWHAPLDGGSDNTRYLLLLQGTPQSGEELLKVLETRSLPTVAQQPIRDEQALRLADWWHPESMGECTAAITSVTNSGSLYSLSLKLFQTESNCVVFASILQVVR